MVLSAGCKSNPLGLTNWSGALPDTVTLYSLSRPNYLGLPSAYDFVGLTTVQVENPAETGNWDIALGEDSTGLVFLLPDVFAFESTNARILPVKGGSLDSLLKAPKAKYDSTVVPIRTDDLYVVQSRVSTNVYGLSCVYYSKLKPLVVDTTTGKLVFIFLSNPNCNDSSLKPGS